jgi:hypothetical protein
MTSTKRIWVHTAILAALLVLPALLLSAERRTSRNAGTTTPDAPMVEMFTAMESNDIEVKMIPKDETEARVFIRNKTQRPLNVKLPDAFAGVPVLAQARAGGAVGGAGANGRTQSVGGGMGGMGGGMGMGMGMMNVPADKVRQFKVATVCLEHGKPEPRAHIPYEIKPLDDVTTSGEVKELLTAFGKQGLSQRATQAAAWHLASGLSWDELVNKRIEHLDGSSEVWFNPKEINSAMQMAQLAMAQNRQKAPRSPGEKQIPSEGQSPGERESQNIGFETAR